MRVRRFHQNQDALQKHEGQANDDLILDRVTYKKLSSLTDNKIIQNPTGKDSEYDRFLLDMDTILKGTNTDAGVALLDQYLGNLGVTIDYPFRDDTYGIESWIDVEDQSPTRNVIADISGVIYNVIAEEGGTDYNVIHDTQEQTIGVRNASRP